MAEAPIAPLTIAATAGLNLGLAWMVGSLASYHGLSRAPGAWARDATRRVTRRLPVGVAVTALCALATLWFETATMVEVSVWRASASVPKVLSSTHYGRGWLIGACALALAGAAAGWRRRGAWPGAARALFGIALSVFICGRALLGHAAAQGDVGASVAIEAAHLLSISLWTGQVAVAGFVVLAVSLAGMPEDARARASYVAALSRSATWALAGVVLTGVLNALRGIGSVADLADTRYGQILTAKLALTAVAVALGAFNRFRVMPVMRADLRASTFVAVLCVESSMLFAVIVLAAWLGTTPPPRFGSPT